MSLEIVRKILIFLPVIAIFSVIALLINHKYKLNKESKEYPAPGNIININGCKMHVYAEGQGEKTFLFMAGHGTPNPTIDFKPLWMRLKNEYKIIVVEKAGYGWSQVSNGPRDIDTMLEETRKALKLSKEKGPYILVPHSMSGLEAIYWAQKYPDEVKAIIGLDPSVPDFVGKHLQIPNKFQLLFMYFISRIGLSRFIPESELKERFPLLALEDLSVEDINQYLAIFYKNGYSKNVLNEIDYLSENVKKIKAKGLPIETPMYFFISNGDELTKEWREILTSYVNQLNNGKYKYLDTGHYLHHEKADTIVKEIINQLDNWSVLK
ncbi:alpha/beta hydrolase [Natronospora cellulosivora (SeqCode)]